MRTFLALLAIILGVTAIVIAVSAWLQFSDIARSKTAPNLLDYPMVQLIGADLFEPANKEHGRTTVDPRSIAKSLQSRLTGLAVAGLVLCTTGLAQCSKAGGTAPTAHLQL